MSSGRNFLINLSGSVVGLLLFAALTPVYFHTIGAERYGVVTVILSLSLYVATFNFGLAPALTYQIAGTLKDDVSAQSEAFWSVMVFTAPIGLAASVVIFGLLPIGLAELMHLSEPVRKEMGGAFVPLVGIGLCTILSANVRGVWHGRQSFVTMSIFGGVETAFTILFPVLTALYVSAEIGALLYATLLTRVLLLGSSIAVLWSGKLQGLRPRLAFAPVRAMLGYGGWVTIGTLVETVASSADRLILGAATSAAQIPIYSIPLQATARSMILPLSLISTVFPKLVGADPGRQSVLLDKTVRFILLLTPGYVAVAAGAAPLLRYWMGRDFADQAAWSLQILAAGHWIEGISNIYYSQLNARGLTRANFLIGAGVVLPYAAGLAVGAWTLGATGVSLVFFLRALGTMIARATWSGTRIREMHAIGIHLAVVTAGVLVSPHAFSSMTVLQAAMAGVAVLLSIATCLWTRPHDLVALLRAVLPTRPSPPLEPAA